MQSYTKIFKINLDFSEAKTKFNEFIKGFGKNAEDLQKPFEDLKDTADLMIEKINKGFENISSNNSFFKSFKEGLGIDNAFNDEIELLYNKSKYLKENSEEIKKNIDSLKDKLSKTEGYDLYQSKQKFKENKSQIYDLKNFGGNDKETKDKIEKLSKENEELSKKIKELDPNKNFDFSEIEKILKEIEKLNDKKEELDQEYYKNEIQRNLKNNEKNKGFNWNDVGKKLGESISTKFDAVLTKFADSFEKLLTDALDEFDEMSKYSLSTSLRVDSDIREQALQYGLSDAQNYAFSKVKDIMGITSDEDLYMMTPSQQNRFAELIGKYTSKYQEIADKDLFSSYEEYLASIQDFQDELQMEVIEFFANNKDTIISALDFVVDTLSSIMEIISWINKTLTGKTSSAEKSALVSDAINSYSVSNANTTTNIKIDNSFSNISPNDQSQYVRAGEAVYRQLITSLDGKLGG